MIHGTVSGYRYHKCRCATCREVERKTRVESEMRAGRTTTCPLCASSTMTSSGFCRTCEATTLKGYRVMP